MPNPQALKEELLQARVAAFYKHEERNDAREVDLLAREADLRLREADLRQREAKVAARLDAREARLDAREAKLGAREEAASAVDRRELASLRAAARGSPAGKRAARAQAPLRDVPGLVAAFQESGAVVPLGVAVAEVEALQQAATRLQAVAEACDGQMVQLDERGKLDLTDYRRSQLEASKKALRTKRDGAVGAVRALRERFKTRRDEGIERFVPLLLQTVVKFDGAFDGTVDGDGETVLEAIYETCRGAKGAQGRALRQPLPTARPPEALETLMELLGLAGHAMPRLASLAAAAARDDCEVVGPCTKGIERALQKVSEDYDGDYTRLLDYARVTLVAETVTRVSELLAFFVSGPEAPRFRCCRIKDRLSREWDAEMSGGNRDIMLNGWLDLGGGKAMIVEVQLHLRVLYELKDDLHVLYDGARVLGAMEDSTARHEGTLSDVALARAESGVVRKLHIPFSPVSAAATKRLVDALKTEPCALLELDLRYATSTETSEAVFDGWTLDRVISRGPQLVTDTSL